jgi:hypothetical protein
MTVKVNKAELHGKCALCIVLDVCRMVPTVLVANTLCGF